jgi:hypothetical protein
MTKDKGLLQLRLLFLSLVVLLSSCATPQEATRRVGSATTTVTAGSPKETPVEPSKVLALAPNAKQATPQPKISKKNAKKTPVRVAKKRPTKRTKKRATKRTRKRATKRPASQGTRAAKVPALAASSSPTGLSSAALSSAVGSSSATPSAKSPSAGEPSDPVSSASAEFEQGTQQAPADDAPNTPLSAEAQIGNSPFDSPGVPALGVGALIALVAVGVRVLRRKEAVEVGPPMGSPTKVQWIEAQADGPGHFRLEFTACEHDQPVACMGELGMSVRMRNGDVTQLGQYEIPLSAENFSEDEFGRPRFKGRFPISAPVFSGHEWLEAEFVITPELGEALQLEAVQFLHPGAEPESSES